MKMPMREFLCVLWPNGNSVCRLRCEKSWRVCLHLQSDQNVKVKLLSIIRGASTVNYCFPTFRTPSPYPNNLSGTHWERGGLGGGKVGEMQEKKGVKNHNLNCH